MKAGSMFSGVEGMGLGVMAALGCEIVWHAEMDPWASRVLERHWPGVPNLGDVQAVDWSKVEPVDLLIGGPPCQAVSSAGRRLGTADPRWMWPEALRAMRELRPRWCLWENPAALLSGKDLDDEGDEDDAPGGDPGPGGLGGPAVDPGWFGWILGEVAAAGFDARWTCVRSSDVGAPHRRDRVFLAAALADGERTWGGADGVPGPVPGRQGVDVRPAVDGRADAPVDLLPTPAARDGDRWGMPSRETALARVANPMRSVNLEDAVALLPTPAAADGERTSTNYGRGNPTLSGALLPTPTASDHKGQNQRSDDTCLPGAVALLPTPTAKDSAASRGYRYDGTAYSENSGVTLTDAAAVERWERYAAAVERWERLFGEPAPGPRDDKGRLHVDLPRWMLGFPSGWLDDIPRTAALRCAGNSCQPQVSALAASLLFGAHLRVAWPPDVKVETH